MDDQEYISLYHELTRTAMYSLFGKFTENPKMILTESDLKCWLFRELYNVIESEGHKNLSVHTEVTHYFKAEERKNKRFRDLTILDSQNLYLNEDLWENNNYGDYTLNKGFKHRGPAMHFELKLIRQGLLGSTDVKLDTSDINNLNNVDINNRAYTIVWGSKNEKFDIEKLKETLLISFRGFNRIKLVENDLLRFYLFDTNTLRAYKLDDEKNLLEINKI